jgi:sec-independent protein translocase protein TatB
VFGMSFGELCVLVIVAIVVIGPKDLPRYLRKAGQLAARLRRMATDVRAQSGIDDVLRSEGLSKDIAEIRRLASGDFIAQAGLSPAALAATAAEPSPAPTEMTIVREREYPRAGADAYGAIPDTSIVYAGGLPKSPLATDPLYVVGDADAPLPPPEPEPEADAEPAAEPEAAPSAAAAPEPAAKSQPDLGHP